MTERIKLQNMPNTRDLGGMPVKDGIIKPHRLLRSGNLAYASAHDIEMLTSEYELKGIVDFRTAEEAHDDPDPQIVGVAYHDLPVLSVRTMGITFEKGDESKGTDFASLAVKFFSGKLDPNEFMANFYRSAVTSDSCVRSYTEFFEILLQQEKGSTLWHCSKGKDRAGLGTALVLLALGASREDILSDYLATNEFVAEENEADARRYAKKAPFFMRRSLRRKLKKLLTVKAEYLQTAFDAMVEHDGSIDGYLEHTLGVDAAKRQRLRELYVAEA